MADKIQVELVPGLWLVQVMPNGTVLWVSVPDDEQERALPLKDAAERLLTPALARVRQMRENDAKPS